MSGFAKEVSEYASKVLESFRAMRGNRPVLDEEITQIIEWVVKVRYEGIVIDLIAKGLVCVDIGSDGEFKFIMTSTGTELHETMIGTEGLDGDAGTTS